MNRAQRRAPIGLTDPDESQEYRTTRENIARWTLLHIEAGADPTMEDDIRRMIGDEIVDHARQELRAEGRLPRPELEDLTTQDFRDAFEERR